MDETTTQTGEPQVEIVVEPTPAEAEPAAEPAVEPAAEPAKE